MEKAEIAKGAAAVHGVAVDRVPTLVELDLHQHAMLLGLGGKDF